MSNWRALLLPAFGRAIGPGDNKPVLSTRELQIFSVAEVVPTIAISGSVLCVGVVAAFWATVPAWMLLGWAFVTGFAMMLAPWLLYGIETRSLNEGQSRRVVNLIIACKHFPCIGLGRGRGVVL